MSSLVVSLILFGSSQQVSGAYTCHAGMKLKASQSTISCSGTACTDGVCCETDSAHVCANSTCTMGTHYTDYTAATSSACCVNKTVCSTGSCSSPYESNGVSGATYDPRVATNKNSACCKITACSSYTCWTGYQTKSSPPTCTGSACTHSECCEENTAYCVAVNGTCTGAKTKMTTMQGTTLTACCIDDIKCSAYVGTASSAVGTNIAGVVLLLISVAVA